MSSCATPASTSCAPVVAAAGALPPSALATWPTQAAYAVKGDWTGLATYNQSQKS